MKYAVIKDDVIVNIVVVDMQSEVGESLIPLPAGAGKGWVLNGTTFEPPAPDMTAIRAGASLSRGDFAEALYDAGILNDAELLEWATGAIPSSVMSDLSNMLNGPDLIKAQARIMSVQQVGRMNELVLLLQAKRQLTDAQVDALYGIGV